MKNYIVHLENKGLAGMEEIFDSGWGYCLPNAPYRLYEVLKRTQGNTNKESWNGYKRIRMQSRLDDAAITTSIQFLLLLGFITYKSGVITQTTNHYSVTNFVNLMVLQKVKYLEHLLKVITTVRQASVKATQAQKFTKNIDIMKNIIKRFKNGEIELIPTEDRIKELSNGQARIICGIGGDADFFGRYEDTLKEFQNFLEAIYSALRTGVNVTEENCKNYCRKDKCKCIKEIRVEDSLMSAILTSKTCAEQAHTCTEQEPSSTKQEVPCTAHDNNKIDKEPYNESYKINNKGLEILDFLKQNIEYFIDEEYKVERLVNKAKELSVSEMEDALKITTLFVDNNIPRETVRYGLLDSIVTKPDLDTGIKMVDEHLAQIKKDARTGRKTKRDQIREAGRAQSHDEFAKICGFKTVREQIDESLLKFSFTKKEVKELVSNLQTSSGSLHNSNVNDILQYIIEKDDTSKYNFNTILGIFKSSYKVHKVMFPEQYEKPVQSDDDLPF